MIDDADLKRRIIAKTHIEGIEMQWVQDGKAFGEKEIGVLVLDAASPIAAKIAELSATEDRLERALAETESDEIRLLMVGVPHFNVAGVLREFSFSEAAAYVELFHEEGAFPVVVVAFEGATAVSFAKPD